MSDVAILSIKPEFAYRILAQTKSIELRRSAMGLAKDDIVLFYISAPDQCLGGWFRIAEIEVRGVEDMWNRHHEQLGIDYNRYLSYFEGVAMATGLHVGELYPLDPVIPLQQIRELIPDFVPPQGITWVRDEVGRYEKFLSKLVPPLPDNAFPQLPLFRNLG